MTTKPNTESTSEGPYVCPGCYAVGGERCAPGCPDDQLRQKMEAADLRDDELDAIEDDFDDQPLEGGS